MRLRRQILRSATLIGVSAAVLGIGPALGAPGTSNATMPRVDTRIQMRSAEPPPPPAKKGMATTGTGANAASHMNGGAVNASTQRCAGGGNESRVGLMNHTGMYAHCNFP